MKIRYTFDNGETSEVEVSEEIGEFITASRRNEENGNRKERYHCWSLDAIDYEDMEYSIENFTEKLLDDNNYRIYKAFSCLSETQKRRILMLANGLSEREIARREGVTLRAVQDCIEGARKSFLKNFLKNPRQNGI